MKTTKYYLLLLLLSISLYNCSQSTNPTEEYNLSDYTNQYTILFKQDTCISSIKSDGSRLKNIRNFDNNMAYEFVTNNEQTKIAFTSWEGLFIMNIDGTNLHVVTGQLNYSRLILNPKFFSLEEALIFYYQDHLYRINFDGSDMKQITPDSISMESHNNSSIHMNKIVFSGYSMGYMNIYLMDTDGSNLTMLTKPDGWYFNPKFSPDGSQIIYSERSNEKYEIFIMQNDGSNKIKLSNNYEFAINASWSQDGSIVYFESESINGKREICFVRPDGSGLKQTYNKIFDNLNNRNIYPSLSPDLTRIAFTAQDGGSVSSGIIYILDVNSGLIKKLANGEGNIIWLN